MTILHEKEREYFNPDHLVPGEIVERSVARAETESGHGYELRKVAVGDESTAEGRAAMNNYLGILGDWYNSLPENEKIPGLNPASNEFFQVGLPGEHVPSMQVWKDIFVPHAPALYPLQRTADAARWFPDGIVDEHAMDIFVSAVDSIAIRARGVIHNTIVLEHTLISDQTEFVAVALGAGAGVPNIDATVKVRDEAGKKITWSLYDLSYDSLEKSKELFVEAEVPKQDIEAFRADYKKAFAREEDSVDVIDMLGLWEYLSTERCSEAVSKLYKTLKPGGVFVFSNMLTTRPQLEVNTGVIGWPGVKPRSIDELIDIVHEAGLDTEKVRATVSDDGVYAVMEIHKP